MHVDDTLMSQLEHLSALRLADAQRPALMADLQRIVDLVGSLQELAPPLTEEHEPPRDHALRDDEPRPGLSREQALAAATHHDAEAFVVPKMLP